MTLSGVHELDKEEKAIGFLRTVGFYEQAFPVCAICTVELNETVKKHGRKIKRVTLQT